MILMPKMMNMTLENCNPTGSSLDNTARMHLEKSTHTAEKECGAIHSKIDPRRLSSEQVHAVESRFDDIFEQHEKYRKDEIIVERRISHLPEQGFISANLGNSRQPLHFC